MFLITGLILNPVFISHQAYAGRLPWHQIESGLKSRELRRMFNVFEREVQSLLGSDHRLALRFRALGQTEREGWMWKTLKDLEAAKKISLSTETYSESLREVLAVRLGRFVDGVESPSKRITSEFLDDVTLVERVRYSSRVASERKAALLPMAEKVASDRELSAALLALSDDLKLSPVDILDRMQRSRVTLHELMTRSAGTYRAEKSAGWMSTTRDTLRFFFADRRIADDEYLRTLFTFVVMDQILTGTAFYFARKDQFSDELDYFVADLLAVAITDVLLISFGSRKASSSLRRGVETTKKRYDNIFDPYFPGGPIGLRSKLENSMDSLRFQGRRMMLAGFVSTTTAYGAVELVQAFRYRDDPEAPSFGERAEKVLLNAALMSSFLGGTSVLRSNLLLSLNRLMGANALLKNHARLRQMIFMALAGGNMYLGGRMWVSYQEWVTSAYLEFRDPLQAYLEGVQDSSVKEEFLGD